MKKEIQAIRLANFRQLIKEAGNISKLAHLCGYTKPVYFYQINAQKETERPDHGHRQCNGAQTGSRHEQARRLVEPRAPQHTENQFCISIR